jgi:anti-sigma factor RsiW
MNCELAHERIVLAAYGELSDELVHELERHLTHCNACREERDQIQALRTLAALHPAVEPPANLVARSRLRLEEALDALPPRRWYERWGQAVINNFARMQSAPVAAALLLAVGVGAGSLAGFEYAQGRAAQLATRAHASVPSAAHAIEPTAAVQAPSPEDVASISRVVRQPNSNVIEVSYNEVVPQQVRGPLDDPQIRALLMLASEEASSAGVRDDSVGLLAAECRASGGCQGDGIRDALMVALRYDRSDNVREQALKGLEPFVTQDMRVRNAVLEALLNDPAPRIRTEAINVLEPVEADTSVRQVLYSVANSDRNPQIRNVSRQALSRVPEIQ